MTDTVKVLSDDEVAELCARPSTELGGYSRILLRPRERDALCATVRALRDHHLQSKTHFLICGARIEALEDQLAQVTQERDDLRAANLSNLLSEIKERLTPEEGREFQSLLMSATKGWVDEVTERSKVDRGLLEAFKDLPKRKKR